MFGTGILPLSMFVEYLIALPAIPMWKILEGIQNRNMNNFEMHMIYFTSKIESRTIAKI